MTDNDTTQLRADLMIAARFLMDDAFTLECDESIRIGMVLAEFAGMLRMTQIETPDTPE